MGILKIKIKSALHISDWCEKKVTKSWLASDLRSADKWNQETQCEKEECSRLSACRYSFIDADILRHAEDADILRHAQVSEPFINLIESINFATRDLSWISCIERLTEWLFKTEVLMRFMNEKSYDILKSTFKRYIIMAEILKRIRNQVYDYPLSITNLVIKILYPNNFH